MAWKEYDKDDYITQMERELSPPVWCIIMILLMLAVLMYWLGKVDARDDMKAERNVTNCATVEIIEKP